MTTDPLASQIVTPGRDRKCELTIEPSPSLTGWQHTPNNVFAGARDQHWNNALSGLDTQVAIL